jgi:hypothetical protein
MKTISRMTKIVESCMILHNLCIEFSDSTNIVYAINCDVEES